MSNDTSERATEQPDVEDDPFACTGCGCYISEHKRIRGEGYCDACLADMGFAVEGYQ